MGEKALELESESLKAEGQAIGQSQEKPVWGRNCSL